MQVLHSVCWQYNMVEIIKKAHKKQKNAMKNAQNSESKIEWGSEQCAL